MKYNPQKTERKWQKYWETKKIYNAKDNVVGKNNFMMLAEFPYTSGNLHIGHWFTYSISDIFTRYLRMSGYNVMNPIGFDAFGLPAENAAIKHNTTPEIWTKKNISHMTKQLKSIGAAFDWSRVVDTSKPDYYQWTQWIFLKLYEKGLVYRAATKVNWCPKDKTVLANEQVVNGCCDRCDTPVIQKDLTQWMFKITEYADALIDDLDKLDWPESAKIAQKSWIGRSEGSKIKFKLNNIPGQQNGKHFVEVFTTRPDTLFGATFIVISPELAQRWIDVGWQASDQVKEYIADSLRKKELDRLIEVGDKTGVDAGIKAINPANKEEIPVWIADYVLGGYGTGAIMAVPAHDNRDLAFQQKYNLGIKIVISSSKFEGRAIDDKVTFSRTWRILSEEEMLNWINKNGAFEGEGILINSSDKFNKMHSQEAKWEITKFVGGERKTQYKLHDWILSRQRYWGAPIPMIKCPKCDYIPVPEKDLPVKLPPLKNFKPASDGRSPLAKASKTWLKVKCPKCGDMAERETDTMDTFVDSSWYFMRYTDPNNKKEFASKEKMNEWLPVPMYIGGREHNTMHLLYARFITKALQGLSLVDFNEPFTSRRNHGVIMGPDGKRMSKSRGNVVDPDVEVKKYGTDAVRINFAFMGPFDQDYTWNNSSINGIVRFLNRVWEFVNRYDDDIKPNPQAIKILNKFTKEIGGDVKELKFNTGVSGLMKLLNELESHKISKSEYETLLKLLAPFAPHIAEELWQNVLKNRKSVHLEKWPEYDEKLIAEEKIKLVVQVNGKIRDTIEVKKGLSENEVKKIVLASENVKKHVSVTPKKVVYVQDRIINFVI
ncbi:MAG: leucine--tRNA ligase [Candidatus Yanofskybacteria bacterium RIFCSPHIGHO2_02_FULL_38_22b]|uniref:Leucine--tRNA ligase n=1 Tax=Candidatus Yanofskybacteria bacterium RIFCSPHIGHO2_02_FULL_38_22b TaxID=1802673 RepID=A0A1F8F1K2_9BACT|nr:MAG: leucine--tRNA ligase [Candidatus Yanofskybacteria bacterium RIFCSPHIGHO2_01_FULL_39_44]OGN07011.1 MAG: leucine--tRNA ligase [Candidatus Yanofskybacteria bacterium RIFCSPHIGHO2_02_FULL_38_22b]